MGTNPSALALDLRLVEFWVLFCTALVFFMQAGFCCLESGLSRSKNSIDVAIKNLIDFCVAGSLFWVCGYALMFGGTHYGLIGSGGFFFEDTSKEHWPTVFFLFQLVYCGTSITIVSGAVAERMRLIPYLILAVVVAGIVYPVFGHWVWAGYGGDPGRFPSPVGWLAKLGFVDFAGSTVVHSLGGWVALAAVICVGPRAGRFPEGEPPRKIQGHNLPMATLGLFILWFGWFGFNGGRTFAPNEQVPLILLNTLLAGVFGGIVGLLFPWMWYGFVHARSSTVTDASETADLSGELGFSVEGTINGVLAGLVAISASCNVVTPPAAVAIGAVAAGVMHVSARWLEHGIWIRPGRYIKVDDVVGAIPAHGFAGAWGTVAVALFSSEARLSVQLLGIVVCFVWAFGIGFVVLTLLKRVSPVFSALRLGLTPEEEKEGLNYVEYQAKTEFYELLKTMQDHLKGHPSRDESEQPLTEIGMIARLYNHVVEGRVALEQAQREAEFRAAVQHAAEEANRSKSDFLALMSHEIRTPMTAVIGFTNVLLESMTNPVDKENLEIIKQNGDHLVALIDDLLDLSKIEAGKLVVERSLFSPVELVEDVSALMSIRTRGTPVQFRTEYAGLVPNKVSSDRTRLRQILINLIGNAIKFTESGSVRLVTRVLEEEDRSVLRFDVIDTGVGMGPETLSKLFRPFSQPDQPTAQKFGGTGLGLTISKRLANMLGGNITVESTLHQGSTFTLTVDCGTLDDVPMRKIPEATLTEPTDECPPEPVKLDCHVLLAEDGRDNQRLIAALLQAAGARVSLAENGQAAVETMLRCELGETPIDVVLMDMRMPELDGYEATRQLRTAGCTCPVIALTAYAMQGDREKCLAAGCDDFATKPIQERRLLKQVQDHVRQATRQSSDRQQLYSALANHPIVGEIIPEFLDGIPEHIAALKRHFTEEDWDNLYDRAHQLKGAFGNYGFHQLTPVVQELLDLVTQRRATSDVSSALQRLIEWCQRLQPGAASVYDRYCSTARELT